jgi:hypothetical protein
LTVAIESISPTADAIRDRTELTTHEFQESAFAGTVGSLDGPMLAFAQLPVQRVKNCSSLQRH